MQEIGFVHTSGMTKFRAWFWYAGEEFLFFPRCGDWTLCNSGSRWCVDLYATNWGWGWWWQFTMEQCGVMIESTSSRKVKSMIPEHYVQNMDSLGLQQLEHLEKELEQAKRKVIYHFSLVILICTWAVSISTLLYQQQQMIIWIVPVFMLINTPQALPCPWWQLPLWSAGAQHYKSRT